MTLRSPLLSVLTAAALLGCHASPLLPGDEDREREGEHPHGAAMRQAQRLDADGTIPPNAIHRMKLQRDALFANQKESAGELFNNWQWLGPGNIGGRIRAIVVHPTQPATMWCGSVGGGIWKTTNGGATWNPLDDFAPVMSVGCMALDASDPDRIYAGTGEGFFNTVAGSSILAASRGAGIFVTTDGGATWAQLPATATPDFEFVNRIAISPKDPKVLLVATGTGIWRSADRGATFTRQSLGFVFDVDFHPTDDKLAVAGLRDGRPRYTLDGGLSWADATGLPVRERVETSYAAGSPGTVYACASQSDRLTIYQSTDGGRTYVLRTSGAGLPTYSRYNNALWVDPSDANHLLVGGVRLHKSTDGGASFVNAYSGSYFDYHVIVEHPGFDGTTNQTVFHGNDGGFYRTTAVKASAIQWQALNNNLGITQFYGAAMTPSGRVLGGTQDNGSLLFTGNAQGWARVLGGDGCYCAADPTDSNYVYGQIYYIRLYRSTNGGSSFRQIASRSTIPDPGSNFIPYIKLDPNTPNRMYFCAHALWVTDNVKATTPSWRSVKPSLGCAGLGTGGRDHFDRDPPCNISVVDVADGNPNIVWAGHNHGDIYMTTNALAATPTWRKVDVTAQPDRWVGSICIDPRDHDTVYATFLGYHRDNVWVTRNGGTTWTPINGTGNGALPETPANWITVSPKFAGCLFLGTDIGLFHSTDDGATWKTTDEGARLSPIQELQWRANDKTLVVITHGRGIHTVDVGQPATVARVGTGCGKTSPPSMVSTPPLLGTNLTFTATGAAASAPVVLMAAPATTPVPLGNGCALQVGVSPILLPAGVTDASGGWTFRLPLPNSKDLLGAEATAQAAVLTPAGPALGIAELTNGLELVSGV